MAELSKFWKSVELREYVENTMREVFSTKSTVCLCCNENFEYAEPRIDFKCWACTNGA